MLFAFGQSVRRKMMEVERSIADLEQLRHSLQTALTSNCNSLTESFCGWTSMNY
jgi:hypothetical protein